MRYLSRPQIARRIGVKPDTLHRYRLPEPDAIIGDPRDPLARKGWLPATIDAWQSTRHPRVTPPEHPEDENDET